MIKDNGPRADATPARPDADAVLRSIELARYMLRAAESDVHLRREFQDVSTHSYETLTHEIAKNLSLARLAIASALAEEDTE